MANSPETVGSAVGSAFNWFDAPGYLTELWFQSMKPMMGVEEQMQSGRDLMTAPMTVCVEETMLLAQVFNSLVQTQVQCWNEMQHGMAQLMVASDLSQPHTNPDSAGAVLCPPDDLSPAGFIKSASNVMTVMADAWMTAVKHDLEDDAPELVAKPNGQSHLGKPQ